MCTILAVSAQSRSISIFSVHYFILTSEPVAMSDTEGSTSTPATGVAISPDQFEMLMSSIQSSKASFDNQFAEFRAEVRLGQEEAAAKALKRVRYDKPYTYKKKGNEEQATFNARVDEALAETQADLPEAATSTALLRAHESLAKDTCRKLIAKRQKLIRIADRSELGWGVVAEYTADELADGSDDEKRLENRRAFKLWIKGKLNWALMVVLLALSSYKAPPFVDFLLADGTRKSAIHDHVQTETERKHDMVSTC